MYSTAEMPDFRRAIQQLRTTRGIGIGKAAQLAGVHRTTLQRWEKGETAPRIAELESLLAALQVNAPERRELLTLLNAPRARLQRQAEIVEISEQQGWGPLPNGGDLLRAMRQRRQWSLEKAAAQIGVTTRTLRRWEQMENWPSPDRLAAICSTLGAQKEECTALTTGLLSSGGNGQSGSLERLHEQVVMMCCEPTTPREHGLRELRLFVLEAQLWPLAVRSANGRRLLAETYALHTLTLANRRQYEEMAAYSERALALEPKPVPEDFWILAQVLGIQADLYCNPRFQPRRAVKYLRHLLPFASRPDIESWLGSWIARMQAEDGAVESGLKTMERACEVAARFHPVEAQLRQLDQADLLLQVHQPARALPLVEAEVDTNVYNRADQLLTRAEAHRGVKDSAAAHNDLAKAFELITAFDLESYRRKAETLARQL